MHLPARSLALGLALLLLLILALPSALRAQDEGVTSKRDAESAADYANAQEYADCMALAQRAPEDALGSAETWEQHGGGDAARHCQAVALVSLGKYGEAAERLEALGRSMPADKQALAAQVLGQAGITWQSAGVLDRALAVQDAALKLAPRDVGLLIDRSATHFFLGDCWKAIDDLNEANELAPDRGDILVFRASAYRCVEAYDLALEDVGRALALEPDAPEALLERGTLRHATGDDDGARADWLKVARDAAGTPTGDAAQMNLERLDLKAE